MTVGTTRSKRRLGRYLRPYLEQSGLKVEQLAKRSRCSRQTASRLFSGDNLPRYHLFTTLLAELSVTGEDRDRALELWEIADSDTVTIQPAGDLPPTYLRFRMDESEARLERSLDTVIIPGLLQTAAYSTAVSLASRQQWKGAWDEEAEVADRKDRQELLMRSDRPLALHALLDEVALRRMVGGPKVMAEQMEHLIEMCRLPNITIQVIPFTAGAYGAMSGPLYLLGFPEDDERDAAYVESLTGMAIVENDGDVARLSAVWDGAAAVALPDSKSVSAIRAVKAKGP
jgi:transcriptional regulator with XRE-family HTH domain